MVIHRRVYSNCQSQVYPNHIRLIKQIKHGLSKTTNNTVKLDHHPNMNHTFANLKHTLIKSFVLKDYTYRKKKSLAIMYNIIWFYCCAIKFHHLDIW